ncbi:hypothetical protein [Altererythrobacter sp. Root672]|uniref:hypothetical protein n=1 Tax=Altererythrobacter sp. Root672 TaxID=1736584 RepID=UPI0006F81290|nr:hypothetical protein [Altererythrobacter sp. Root672]KRA83471.1 hypothetical protein ASD76_05345 [Altererythrobacter sp. Root672]
MKRLITVIAALTAFAVAMPVYAQSNDDDYTPLNSRIKRKRQFPTDLHNPWGNQMTEVARTRSKAMMTQFSRCVYQRSRTGSVELLDKTDYGFGDFNQIGYDQERALRVYGFKDCLGRVANTHGTGVQLRFSAASLRQWLVQEAYMDRYADGPAWIQPGNEVTAREYPLSGEMGGVVAAMDLADCVVAADPYTSDFLFRTAAGSDVEKQALEKLMPALSSCLPSGRQVQLDPSLFRIWIGEGLWHAATHSSPAPVASPESAH